MEYKDYYKILGVERGASQKDIQRAYRRLARKHHPDVKPNDPQAAERFKEINEAYEVLGDAEKRRKYDRFGAQWREWQSRGGDPSQFDWSQWFAPGGRSRVHVEYGDLFGRMGGGVSGFSDFFEALFGGLGGPRAGRAGARGADIEQPVEITLQEALRGTTRVLQVDGRRIEARIPAGVADNSRVRISGLGAPGAGAGLPGDLYLRVRIQPHPRFQRQGHDLQTTVDVPVYLAALGGEVPVDTLEGRVMLKLPPETQSGQTFRLRGKGVPRGDRRGGRGDLLVRVNVVLPQPLNPRERELFEELRRLREGR